MAIIQPTPYEMLIFSGPSGAGKSTIVNHLLEQNPHLAFSVSASTRPQRAHEIHGKDYYFLSEEAFKEKIASGEMLEWQEVYPGSFYGTLKSEVNKIYEEKKIPIFDIDVHGGINLKEHYQDKALTIYINVPYDQLAERLKLRGSESLEHIEQRLSKARIEATLAPEFDLLLHNLHLPDTLRQAQGWVNTYTSQ